MGPEAFAAIVREMRKYQRRRWDAQWNKYNMKSADLARLKQLEGLVDAALKGGGNDRAEACQESASHQG